MEPLLRWKRPYTTTGVFLGQHEQPKTYLVDHTHKKHELATWNSYGDQKDAPTWTSYDAYRDAPRSQWTDLGDEIEDGGVLSLSPRGLSQDFHITKSNKSIHKPINPDKQSVGVNAFYGAYPYSV